MNTPVIDQDNLDTATFVPARRRTWKIVAGIAAAAVVAVGTAAIIGNSGGGGGETATSPLELSLGDGNATSSCIRFDVALLADMSPAFAGTATAVEGETVTLNVDRWYTGGDAAITTVVLRGSSGLPAIIDGFQFEVGKQYLITATEGNVNFCGYSGVVTPELTAAFEAAFGS